MSEPENDDVRALVRRYVVENYFRGDQARDLTDDTPLVSTGFIDSIGVIGLVSFIESRFGVEFMPREIDLHNLETVGQIEGAIRRKLGQSNPV